jgi:hypothetical protein
LHSQLYINIVEDFKADEINVLKSRIEPDDGQASRVCKQLRGRVLLMQSRFANAAAKCVQTLASNLIT